MTDAPKRQESSSTEPEPPAEPGVEVGPNGSALITNPSRSPTNGSIELAANSEDATVQATGQHLDDRDPHVALSLSVAGSTVNVALDTDTARALAADLDRAARGAEDPAEVRDD